VRASDTACLGKGGEAFDTGKDRTVALKILPEDLSRSQQFRTRFQRESRAAAVLEEPHVIPIHDWGEIEGQLYIDMRLVRGQDLHELLKRGPLEPARAVAIIGQIASALDAAHQEGLIHRDVKPQNILLTPADFAYLIDFGIAEAREDTRLTMAGSAIGSVVYMAPERFDDRPTTPAVDIYSLAAVLYESLTGEAPFKSGGMEQLIAAHVSSPPPRPSVVNPRVPTAFDDVIARGMAKEPDDRYGSPGALGRAAQRALGATSLSGPTTGPNATTQEAPGIFAGPGPYDTGPTRPAWQVPEHKPSQARPWLMPAVVIVAAALVLAGIGVIIGLLARQSSARDNSSAGPSPSSYTVVPTVLPSNQPESPTAPPSQAARPPPGVMGPDNSASHESCDAGYSLTNKTGFGTHSERGTPETSCYFANSVLVAYWNRWGDASRELRSVSAQGAVPCGSVAGTAVCDGNNFVVQCQAVGGDSWITCTGGNDARVYLY